jgi:S-adenosylmethionine synthetase
MAEKQTALNKLISELGKTLYKPGMMQVQSIRHQQEQKERDEIVKGIIQKAKELLQSEKEQIIDARLSLDKSDNIWDSAIAFEEAEKYYKETYK